MKRGRFKGKTYSGNQWVKGSLFSEVLYTKHGKEQRDCIRDDDGNIHRIKPETLCQSTGSFDAHGIEIFQDDFLLDDDVKYLVKWDRKKAIFFLESEAEPITFDKVSSEWYEVFGNIQDQEE